MRYIVFFLLLVGLGVGSGQAQSLGDLRGNAGAYYKYVEDPSDITIEVKVWGRIDNPGLYEVRQGLTLSTLLTLAGGPQAEGRAPRMSSTLTMRLYRQQPDGRFSVLSETLMEDELLVLDQDPVLQHGDILIADETVRQRFSWRDGLSIVTALGTLALVVERLASN